eukprot:scaffold77129_cov18-Prasinocladus_malaysianus.AAC.2
MEWEQSAIHRQRCNDTFSQSARKGSLKSHSLLPITGDLIIAPVSSSLRNRAKCGVSIIHHHCWPTRTTIKVNKLQCGRQ